MLEAIANLKDELKQIGKWSIDEINQVLENGIQKYVINYQEKFGKTKTFVFRDERIDFYKIYFPLSLYNKGKQEPIKVPLSIDELFKDSNCITILGNAGSGKTMLLRHCFLSTLKYSSQIPIVIELRRLNSYSGTLTEYIQEQVSAHKLAQNKSILERLLESGKFTFMLDGFDELSLNTKEQRTRELEMFIDKYFNNYYLLTSRPGANAENLSRFNNYHVRPLMLDQIKEFIHLQLCIIEDGGSLECKMLDIINKPESKNYRIYLSSPLLLSMFILTFSNHPELPTLKSKFYYNVFDTLYSRHDTISKSGGYTHEKKTNLEKEQIETVLKWFSYISYFESHFLFDKEYLSSSLNKVKQNTALNYNTDFMIYDLSVAISILIIDGLDFSFPHRSLQEYFTAILIKNLPEKIKKEKIYHQKLVNRNWEGDLNLWELCNEVDKYCFSKYFLIEQLDILVKEIGKGVVNIENDKIIILKNYLSFFNYKLYFGGEGDKEIRGVNFRNSKYEELMKFLRISQTGVGMNYLLNIKKKQFKKMEPYFESFSGDEILKFVFDFSEFDDTLIQLYEETGFINNVCVLYKKILENKKRIENKLKQEYETEIFLLDLV